MPVTGTTNESQYYNLTNPGTGTALKTSGNSGGSVGLSTIGNGTGSSLPNAGTGWWTYGIIDNWGVATDPQGAYPKPDINILLPANFPIANILPGVVSGINGGDVSYGACITIKLDTPLNALATHIAWNHLQVIQPGMYVGKRVNPGDIVAYGGANQSAGSAPAAVGFILYPGDNYATDAAFSQYFKYGQTPDWRLYPKPVLDALNAGKLGDPSLYSALFAPGSGPAFGGSGTGDNTTLTQIVKKVIPINPGENVTMFLEHIDYALALIDPIPDPTQVDKLPGVLSGIPNPLSWTGDLLHNLFVVDLPSLVLRGFIISIGIYTCFKVVDQYTNISGIVSRGGKIAGAIGETIL
jgi:hypothetical protein